MKFSVRQDRDISRLQRERGFCQYKTSLLGTFLLSSLVIFLPIDVSPAFAASHGKPIPSIYVTDYNLTSGSIVPASHLFEIEDTSTAATDTSAVISIEITDPPGGGAFEFNGARYDGVTFAVPAADFPALKFVAGAAGSESISAQASDGTESGETASVNVTTSDGVAGVIVDAANGEVFMPDSGWLGADEFFKFYYANPDMFTDVGYAQPLQALRDFVN